MLPIKIETIPTAETSLQVWRVIEARLSAIAVKEKNNENLYPSERTAYNAIAYAKYQAHKKQWRNLWEYLLDRQVLQIGEVISPPRKPRNPTRPTKPPKVATRKKMRKPRKIMRFARLKPSLIRLRVFLWFCDYVVHSAPLCHAKSPLANRPDGDRIKALLSYKASGGDYCSLKLYLPSIKARYKIHPNVLRVLLDWSNPLRERSEVKINSDRQKGLDRRIVSDKILNQALTDKWQDVGAIAARLNSIIEAPLTFKQVSKLLSNRYRTGEIYRFNREHHDVSYYSQIEATEFESQWLTLEMAYQLAISRGCKVAKNTFRKNHRCDYSAFGLEFRREVPEFDNKLLRWRDCWKDGNF